MFTHITPKSSNKKVVGETKDGFDLNVVTTTTKESCPDGCQHKRDGSCYASEGWHLNMHWDKVTKQERGADFKTFAKQLEKALADNEPFRHNQAGDLLGYAHDPGNSIDSEALELLTKVNQGKRGFTYTHKDIFETEYTDKKTASNNLKAITKANQDGFTINLSADSISKADQYFKTGNPVAVTVSENYEEKTVSPNGNKIVVCPVQTGKAENCARCLLCQRGKRKVIVAFRVHGKGKNKFNAVA